MKTVTEAVRSVPLRSLLTGFLPAAAAFLLSGAALDGLYSPWALAAVSAAGVLNSLTKDYVSENQIVIDVSINWDPEKVNSKGGKGAIAGDAVFSAVEPIVGAITPVPGGVGSVTTSVLIGHVVEAAERTL